MADARETIEHLRRRLAMLSDPPGNFVVHEDVMRRLIAEIDRKRRSVEPPATYLWLVKTYDRERWLALGDYAHQADDCVQRHIGKNRVASCTPILSTGIECDAIRLDYVR